MVAAIFSKSQPDANVALLRLGAGGTKTVERKQKRGSHVARAGSEMGPFVPQGTRPPDHVRRLFVKRAAPAATSELRTECTVARVHPVNST